MAKAPKQVSIRTYQVGFGDCFLLSFVYAGGSKKHVLIDFGTTKLPPAAPKTRMVDIANDIKKVTGGKLHAVVATHRHADHISGFATTTSGKGSGDIIASLKPDFVVQPWTEDPKAKVDSTGPAESAEIKKHITALSAMHEVARFGLKVGNRARHLDKGLREQLSFLGEDNIGNPSAVNNLMKMSKKPVYLYAGAPAQFDAGLGIKVHVLGPPTVKQTKTITKQKSRDADEFWQFQAGAAALATRGGSKTLDAPALFPRHVLGRKASQFPIGARWLIFHSKAAQGEQLLQIVRTLDKAMNNTSIILAFEVAGQCLLFPGDAQIENWQYALGQAKNKALLSSVKLYKVGHHGSLNATPKSLWKMFKNRSKAKKKSMRSLMSTLEGKHGHKKDGTEVPRTTLVSALKAETDLFSTETLKGAFFHDTIVS